MARRYGTIIYEVRDALNLNNNQYLLLDAISKLQGSPSSKTPGYCDAGNEYLAAVVGVTLKNLIEMRKRLEADGMLERHPNCKKYRVTSRFYALAFDVEQAGEKVSKLHKKSVETTPLKSVETTLIYYKENNTDNTVNLPAKNAGGLFSEFRTNSKAPKEKKQAPGAGGEPWTKEAARIFDAVLQDCQKETPEEEKLTFNWQAGAGRHFASLKKLRDAMAADMRRKMEKETLSEEDYKKGFEIIFSNGFEYLQGIAANLGGSIKFSPAIILNNYNQILHHARTKHITRQNTPRQNDDAGRTAFYQELARSSSNLDL
jgi:hypothetical protein